jgi:hypothetical protein
MNPEDCTSQLGSAPKVLPPIGSEAFTVTHRMFKSPLTPYDLQDANVTRDDEKAQHDRRVSGFSFLREHHA